MAHTIQNWRNGAADPNHHSHQCPMPSENVLKVINQFSKKKKKTI